MSNSGNQFLYDGKDGDGVSEAVVIAERLVRGRKEANDYETKDAIRDVARTVRCGPSQIRRLLQPSRRPKAVALSLYRNLVRAYYAHLRGRLAELETEMARVEALGLTDHRAMADLLSEAKALTSRIEALIGT